MNKQLIYGEQVQPLLIYAYVAINRFNLFFEPKLSPWDYAAAALIIEEAGGYIRDFEGKNVSLSVCSSVLAGSKTAVKEFIPSIRKYGFMQE